MPRLLSLLLSVVVGSQISAQDIQVQGQPARPNAPVAKDLHGDLMPHGAIARLGTVRFRCSATSTAYSPDGKLLAVGGDDNQIRLLDAATGREIRRLSGHQARTYNPPRDIKSAFDLLVGSMGLGNVTTVAFSPDGKTLASGGWDDMVRFWDVETGKELRKVVAHLGMVARVVFSPDGKFLASRGGIDGVVRLWDVASGAELRKLADHNRVNPWRFYRQAALAFSPDSKTLVASSRKAIVFYDVASGKETAQWPGYRDCMFAAYSPDGNRLATGGLDDVQKESYSLRIWTVATGQELVRCDLPKTRKGGTEPPTGLAFSPKGDKLIAAIAEMDTYLFDAATGKQVHRLAHYWSRRVDYSPDGKTVVSVGGPTLRLWDAETGKERFFEFAGHRANVAAVAVSPDGKLIATAGEIVRLWDASTSKVVRELATSAVALSFAPDGKTLVTAGGNSLRHWDMKTGQEAAPWQFKSARLLRSVVHSPDGKSLAVGDEQAVVQLLDSATGKELWKHDMQSIAESLTLAFSPDGKSLACAGAWNQFGLGGITLNLQGRVTVGGKEGWHVLMWDTATGKETRRFGGLKDNVKSVAFSPDGKTLAGSSRDGRLLLWDAATGKERLHILAHPPASAGPAAGGMSIAFTHSGAFAAIPALAFAPDGKVLASAGADRTIRFWDPVTAKELGVLTLLDGSVTALVYGPGGKTLISGSSDTSVLVWDAKAALAPPAPPKLNIKPTPKKEQQ